ncbi:TonB-linked outer membrane protein, SusC/RagA family [Chitinophaga jiangningensis]|uniref:TonB-linked outer membrane protein, SusC/RagA family n=1 Tax=Chitinophaga jiangningensis TaxID=1419482 RepID=A0A1M7M8Y6_9BACT|nr:SusC/RagA family TonB-linked outer membrane protein [Chitinophaga jiangningensis]SHM87239.1 TonB-linked outer membrane protein, SusC/RagA family [Chitinophaga jiangningensis]
MKALLSIVLLLCCVEVMAQRTLIRGKATDEKNNPLPGVSIMVKDSRNGVATAEDGSFSIYVTDPQNTVLRATMTGYEPQETILRGRTSIQFSLNTSAINLKNVVVTGAMGINRTSKSIGYATQSVNPENLTEARDLNIVNGLAGKVAGLQVTGTGQPGSSSRVIIRGENSLTQNNQPLWVVDGVPINNDMGDGRDNLDFGNGAADLNPDDIASIQVLQGPNAAALYGSRAANGAILVTTKKGKINDGNLGIAINQNTQMNSIAEFPEYQNVYGEGANGFMVGNGNNIVPGTGAVKMGLNGSTWGMPMLGQPYNDFSGKPIAGGYRPHPDNITSFYQPSVTNVSNISMAKADAVSALRLSYTFTASDDVLKNQNKIIKHNVALTGSRKFGNFLNIDARVMYTNQDTKNRTYRNLDPSSPMAAYVYLPRSVDVNALDPWKDAFGNSFSLGSVSSVENPLWMLYENENRDQSHRWLAGITATAKLTSKLNFRLQASSDMKTTSFYQYRELGGLRTPNGFYSNSNQQNTMWNYQGMLMYNNKVNQSLNIAINAGAEYVTFNNQFRGASIASLLVHDMPSIQNSTAFPAATESLVRSNVQSVYGDATVSWRDFLFLNLTGRNDWSSTLPAKNNNYFYPSVNASFVFSNFLKEGSVLNYGKVRASVAQVGNAAPPQSLLTTYTYGGLFLGNPYLNYGNNNQLNNGELMPEKTLSREAGVELAFFRSRLQLTANVYQSNTTNQIIRPQIPNETGFSTRILNAGEMRNRGVEVSTNIAAVQSKKLKVNVLANWSMNRNKVLSLVPNINILALGTNLGATVNAIVGQQYGVLTGNAPYRVHDTLIVNPSNGRTIADPNVVLGNFHPDWIGSLGTQLKYGPVDLSVLFTVKMGGVIYSASYGRANFAGTTAASLYGRDEFLFSNVILGENDAERMGTGQATSKGNTVYGDKDRPKGARYPNAYFPLTDSKGVILLDAKGRMMVGKKSDIWMNPTAYNSDMVLNNTPAITFDASNIRLSELICGYTLPVKYIRSTPVKSLRLAFVGRNLWTIFKNTPRGIDPEAANTSGNAQGIESGGSFPYSIYGFDLKVTF